MPDTCNPSDCPVNVKVDALKERFDAHMETSRETHSKLFDKIGDLEQDRSATKAKLEAMDGKLDKLVAWREEQDNKPNRLIDHLKENAINYIMLAMMGLMLLKMGLSA